VFDDALPIRARFKACLNRFLCQVVKNLLNNVEKSVVVKSLDKVAILELLIFNQNNHFLKKLASFKR